jgi:hypothetical protein
VKRAWLAGLGLVLSFAACSGPASSRPSSEASLIPSPAPSGAAGSPVATSQASTAGPAGSGLIAVDQSLLGYLPAAVGSIAVVYSPEATQSVLNDAALARSASAIAYGLAIDPATNDFVIAAVARLREGVFSDAFYRDWRSTYDRGACAQAGGVAGNAETTIGGRVVYIGTCRGGAHTYHVFLALSRVMISATSVGSKRFGEQLVMNLRNP